MKRHVPSRHSDAFRSRRGPAIFRGLVVLALLAGSVYLYILFGHNRRAVIVEINGVRVVHMTYETSAEAILQEIGFEPSEVDSMRTPSPEELLAGVPLELVVARRFHLLHDGTITEVFCHGEDLGKVLASVDLSLYDHDEVWLEGQPLSLTDPLPEVMRPRRASASEWIAEIRRPLQISVKRAVPLSVDDGRVQSSFYTTARTVGEALFDKGILLYVGDRIFPAPETSVGPELAVTIERSRPVTLHVDGLSHPFRTRVDSVNELLQEAGVLLDEQDYITPEGDAAIESGLEISVVRVYEEYYVEETPIAFETRWQGNPELEIDQRRTAHWGREGAWRQQVKVYYENGQEVHRTEEDAWVAREPEDRILEYGTQIVVRQMDTPNGPMEYWRKLRVLATSYNAPTAGKPPSHPTYGITRLGERARMGVIAVDPNLISLRQPLYVPGYGRGFAGDTGGAIKGRRIDLCYDDHNLVLWHRWVDVYLLTPVPPHSSIPWIIPNDPGERE